MSRIFKTLAEFEKEFFPSEFEKMSQEADSQIKILVELSTKNHR